MKRFEFRLERVRSWRQEQAELEELRLEHLLIELRRYDEQRMEARAEMARADQSVRGQATVSTGDLALLEMSHQYTRARLQQLENAKRQCQTRIDEQRKLVLEAHRQFELLDRLHQKTLAEWHAARTKEEEELSSELFLAKRSRDLAQEE